MMNGTVEESPDTTVPEAWIVAAQGWAWTVSCVGGVGNLVTISTIAHQLYLGRLWRRHYQCGHRAGRPVVALEGDTLLLLHLSFCDFLYCAVNLPLTAITYNYAIGLSDTVPSKSFCTGAALFRYINALAEWTTLGLLTVQRCVDLGRSRGARFFRPRPTISFIVAIWLGSVLLQMDAIVQGQYNYDRTTYKCDYTSVKARIYFYCLESLLPCCLMFTGSLSIIFQIWRNTRMLRAAGMPKELVQQRFCRMLRSTALLLALLLLYLVCVIPVCVYSVVSIVTDDKHVPLGIAIFMNYWIQYGINFLVYAASNANYRKAYKQFFKLIVEQTWKTYKSLICNCSKSPSVLQLSSVIVRSGSVAILPLHSSLGFSESDPGADGCILPPLGFHFLSSSS
ncbi:protein trapped in endoderm-1-like [Procambarus clarkii]|uniref:protein trapped in endoderm-1-like n=1 Tax=Procambarus clarkii TaxID=6728 RepID=UPI001E675463|nr:protein trapped in endoderm-1-like [Procambarus clarkii]